MLAHLLTAICFEALYQWALPGLMMQGIGFDREVFLGGTFPVQVEIWQVPTMLQHGCNLHFTVDRLPNRHERRRLEATRH